MPRVFFSVILGSVSDLAEATEAFQRSQTNETVTALVRTSLEASQSITESVDRITAILRVLTTHVQERTPRDRRSSQIPFRLDPAFQLRGPAWDEVEVSDKDQTYGGQTQYE